MGPQLDEIGTSVGVDHKVGLDGRPGWLYQDVHATRIAIAALRITDDPSYRVAGGHRAGAGELLARLQGNVGDLSWGDVDLIEGPRAVRKHLYGVEVALAARLHPRGAIGSLDARHWIPCIARSSARRSPSRWNVQRPWRRILGGRGGHRKRWHALVVTDLRRLR